MTYNNFKARNEICNHVIAKYNKINVSPGKLLYNFQCHRNSVHIAKKRNHKKLAMCVYIDEGYPIIHFVNYRKKVYIDNTLGMWTTQNDYYFIKWVREDEMWNIFDTFEAFRIELGNALNWWTRLTSDYRG